MTNENSSVQNIPATMAGLMLCLFLSALDNSIVGTAMPKIITDLQGLHNYSLPFTAYLLFSTIVIPIAGKLSDVLGRKVVITWGIILFIITSVLCGLSINMPMFIVFRGLQGACSGVLASSAFIITSELFPPQQRGKYIGILASMHGLASLLGPVTGGVISDFLSWHWIFFINIPIGLIALWFIKRSIPTLQHHNSSARLNITGVLIFLSSVFPFLFCFAEGGKLLPWMSPIFVVLLVFAVFMMIFFIRVEKKSQSPLLPSGLLQNAVFRKSAFGAAMAYVALFGLILYIPYLLQIILHKGATFSGLMMLPMSLSMVCGGMLGGAITTRLQRYRLQGIINFSIAFLGMLILWFGGNNISTPLLIFSVITIGLGIGMNFPVINIAPQSAFSQSQLGIVISTLEFFQIMGGVIATSIFGNMLHSWLKGIILFSMTALLLGLISMWRLNDNEIREGFALQAKTRK